MKKGKIIMTVTVGLMCFVLTYVMFMQFKLVEETDITEIENARESELKEKLATWKSKYEDVITKLEESTAKLTEYYESKESNQETSQLLTKELEQAKKIAGLTEVKGDGIVVTLTDGEEIIKASDLIELVNELRLAGAEAISINDKRVVNMTDIVDITDTVILVNLERVSSPYVIKAIGNPKYLESALNTKTIGFMDQMSLYGKSAILERQNNIKINPYNKKIEVQYMKVKEEEK